MKDVQAELTQGGLGEADARSSEEKLGEMPNVSTPQQSSVGNGAGTSLLCQSSPQEQLLSISALHWREIGGLPPAQCPL